MSDTIDSINIKRQNYSDVLDALIKEAELDNYRVPTQMATILIMEAIAAREAKRKEAEK